MLLHRPPPSLVTPTCSLKPCDHYLSRDASVKVNVRITLVRVCDNLKSTHIQRAPDNNMATKRHANALGLQFQAAIAVEIVVSAVVFSCLVFFCRQGWPPSLGKSRPRQPGTVERPCELGCAAPKHVKYFMPDTHHRDQQCERSRLLE